MKRSSVTGMIYGREPLGTPLPAPLSESGSIALDLAEGEELRVSAGSGFGYAVYLIPKSDPGEMVAPEGVTPPDSAAWQPGPYAGKSV